MTRGDRWTRLWRRLRPGLRVEREVEDEVRFHIEGRAQELMREGMTEDEARVEAERRFGDVGRIEEEMRALGRQRIRRERRWGMVQAWIDDVGRACRGLIRSPGGSGVAVLTLSVGIGASSAVFSLVEGVLLRPLPFAEADGLAMVWHRYGDRLSKASVSPPNFIDYRDRSGTFASLAAIDPAPMNLTSEGEPERVPAGGVTEGFFRTLGIEPVAGGTFVPGDHEPGAAPVVVLSEGLWRRRFGGDPSLVGRTVRIDDVSRTVRGVVPDGAALIEPAELWIPRSFAPEEVTDGRRGFEHLTVVGRLRSGRTLEAARADMAGIADALRARFPDRYRPEVAWGIRVESLRDEVVGEVRMPLLLMSVAVGFVLLIVCANVASLLLARGLGRSGDLAVRMTLGARRGRIARELLTESLVLACAGGVLGLLLARWSTDVLLALSPESLPRAANVGLNPAVVLFTALVSGVAGVLAGVAPVLQARGVAPGRALSEVGRAFAGSRRVRTRQAFVVAQMVLGLVLLAGAGLTLRSFANLLDVPLQFRPEGVLVMDVSLPAQRYDAEGRAAFWDRLLPEVRALPGVEEAGATALLPLDGRSWNASFALEGETPETLEPRSSDLRVVTPGYFRALGIPLLRGRPFLDSDRLDAARVVVVDRRLAEVTWPDQDPIGKRITFDRVDGEDVVWREVVGLVEAVPAETLEGGTRGHLYLPYGQSRQATLSLAVQGDASTPAAADPLSLLSAVRERIRVLDPDLPVADVTTMEAMVGEARAGARFMIVVLGFFAGTALFLAALGLYGVVDASVRARTREMGLRAALGADPGRLRRLVVAQVLRLVALGLVLGVPAALVASRVLRGLLFGVSPTDPVVYVGLVAAVAVVAVVAGYLPARRATRVDPVVALREG